MRALIALLLAVAILFGLSSAVLSAEAPVRAAVGEIEITPDVKGKTPVYLAGYGMNRRATGVHDPLYARGVVLEIGGEKLALVSVDLVGLQYPTVVKIRARLKGYKYVMVSSTHNHEGPDVIGIWGPTPIQSGVDPAYLKLVEDRVVKLVETLAPSLAAVDVAYGTAEDESLLGDSRLPKVYDGVLRTLRLKAAGTDKTVGLIVQWNCHPEAMGSRNKLVTSDFVAGTVAALKEKYKCPVAYFSGAVGGLMSPPDDRIKNAKGVILKEGQFEYSEEYGRQVAKLAEKAVGSSKPIELSPLVVSTKPIAIPLANPLYQIAQAAGVLSREGRVWTGDAEKLGERITAKNADSPPAVETEVAYLRLGELHVACIPGEIYPELIYGKFQEPAEKNADFPDAPLEKPVLNRLPGEKTLVIGLANDEVGYIIPKRQWDHKPPYAYGRSKSQYGEINSCGPDVAPILMQALENRVREAERRQRLLGFRRNLVGRIQRGLCASTILVRGVRLRGSRPALPVGVPEHGEAGIGRGCSR